ncbi:Hypothetical Protein FCC1311_039232 [Hondaea fermentalgiana]|uniref:Uncharacterized protein n=1 Tax=Hondaea fermentalgiana TaxID=2315210 RepID=A0A2R5G9J1_9STRA|nr:Hypothetical Protein FCC1311_039232 [Hondaea fermentalgiana]|eukprot:GBG27700.1 Hypothetical Protein FCC1311_039232 [Hondaea fermentalgiana]
MEDTTVIYVSIGEDPMKTMELIFSAGLTQIAADADAEADDNDDFVDDVLATIRGDCKVPCKKNVRYRGSLVTNPETGPRYFPNFEDAQACQDLFNSEEWSETCTHFTNQGNKKWCCLFEGVPRMKIVWVKYDYVSGDKTCAVLWFYKEKV